VLLLMLEVFGASKKFSILRISPRPPTLDKMDSEVIKPAGDI